MIKPTSNIDKLIPYKPGQTPEDIARLYGITQAVKLASNENPLGISPFAAYALRSLHDNDFSLYPDGGMRLRIALAEHLSVGVENVISHSGSDAILHLAHRTFIDNGDTIVSSQGTFIGFQVAASLSGAKTTYTPLTKDYRYDAKALTDAVTPKTKILYIANVNNPTGTYLRRDELIYILDNVPETTLVILDEAYFEYSAYLSEQYPDAMLLRRPNVLILRTFSKCYGLAGLRVGYGIGDKNVIASMIKAKLPFEPNIAGQTAAIAALQDKEFLKRTLELNARGLKLYQYMLQEIGVYSPETAGNFIMLDCNTQETAQSVFLALLKKGFITRPLAGGFSLSHCIRVSTGADKSNANFCNAMKEVAEEIPSIRKINQ